MTAAASVVCFIAYTSYTITLLTIAIVSYTTLITAIAPKGGDKTEFYALMYRILALSGIASVWGHFALFGAYSGSSTDFTERKRP
jgi:hypothetical protein